MKILTALLLLFISFSAFPNEKINKFVYVDNGAVVDVHENPNAVINIKDGKVRVLFGNNTLFNFIITDYKEVECNFYCKGYFNYSGQECFLCHLIIEFNKEQICYDFILSDGYHMLVYTK